MPNASAKKELSNQHIMTLFCLTIQIHRRIRPKYVSKGLSQELSNDLVLVLSLENLWHKLKQALALILPKQAFKVLKVKVDELVKDPFFLDRDPGSQDQDFESGPAVASTWEMKWLKELLLTVPLAVKVSTREYFSEKRDATFGAKSAPRKI